MTALFRRLRARWRYRHFDRELATEIDVHRVMKQQELEASGVASADARAGAFRALGNVTYMREEARSVWISRWLQQAWQDMRYALRGLRRQPLFTLTAVGILGLAIGLLTTVVLFMDASLLQPWRVPNPGDVFMIRPAARLPSDLQGMRVPEYLHIRQQKRAWQDLAAASRGARATLTFSNGVVATSDGLLYVTENYFDMLGVELTAGRMFSAQETDATAPADLIVIGHRIWKQHLNGDPNVIGTNVRLRGFEGRPFTIVGIGPRGFVDGLGSHHEAWVPLGLAFGATPDERHRYLDPRHPSTNLTIVGRLKSGVMSDQGAAELAQLSNAYRASVGIERTSFRLQDTRPISSTGNRDRLNVVLLIAGALVLVQLLACANVGNLLLARALARQREMAVRLSLGAGRARIVRQLLTEAGLLIVLAAAFGLAMALTVPYFVIPLFEDADQRPEFYGPGLVTFATLVGLAALCTIVTGLAPALRATRVGLSTVAGNRHGGSPGGVRLRRLLLSAQIALATVLLSGAGLLTRGLMHAMSVEPGFPVAEFQEITVDVPGMGNQRERRASFYRQLFDQTRSAEWPPIALADFAPVDDAPFVLSVHLQTASGTRVQSVRSRPVSSNYFDVLGVPLLTGRMPAPDSRGSEVVLNRLAAQLLSPNESPLGKTINTGFRANQLVPRTIVGIVPDLPTESVVQATAVAYSTSSLFRPLFLVRSGDPHVASRIETIARSLEPAATVTSRPLRDMIADSLFFARVGSRIAWAIGAIGLVLATVGAFGVFAYAVEERRREVGIRMALGARAPQVIALVLRSTQTTVASGLVIGVALAAAAAPLLRKYLYGLSPYDPIVYVQVALILATAAGLATWLPARRATRVNPAEALRAE